MTRHFILPASVATLAALMVACTSIFGPADEGPKRVSPDSRTVQTGGESVAAKGPKPEPDSPKPADEDANTDHSEAAGDQTPHPKLELGDDFWELFDGGLAALEMTREDLNFAKRIAKDVEFQLEPMKEAMDNPTRLPGIAARLVGREKEAFRELGLVDDKQELGWEAGEVATPEALIKEFRILRHPVTNGTVKSFNEIWELRELGEKPTAWLKGLKDDSDQGTKALVCAYMTGLFHATYWQAGFSGADPDMLESFEESSPSLLLQEINGHAIEGDFEKDSLMAVLSSTTEFPQVVVPFAVIEVPTPAAWFIGSIASTWRPSITTIAQMFLALHQSTEDGIVAPDQRLEIKVGDQIIVLAGEGDTVHHYETSPLLVIDFGGNDTYTGAVAVADSNQRFTALFDYGQGDDRYIAGTKGNALGPCAAQGGATVLYDDGGDDSYLGGDISLGAAWLGAATLIDAGGADTYTSGQFTQGAGFAGWGELIDKGDGNDIYTCARYGQAFGYVLGYGRLEDEGGNDRYYAGGVYLNEPLFENRYQSMSQGFGIGARYSNLAGGIGVLVDRGTGNDTYHADIYGQGASYWYSLGVLWDEGGNDQYTLGQYGQGGGIHLSAGILVDLAGDDAYVNPHGIGTGGAHDYAVGWLIDMAGNDSYYSNGIGQGLNNSVGVLYDAAGDDAYSSRHPLGLTHGSNYSVSILVDGAGTDSYTQPVTNGLWYISEFDTTFGIVVDNQGEGDEPQEWRGARMARTDPLGPAPEPDDESDARNGQAQPPSGPPPVPGSDVKGLSDEELEDLWKKSCLWQVGDNIKVVDEARRTLVKEGALDFLLTKMDGTKTLMLRALWDTVPHFGDQAVDPLLGKIKDENFQIASCAVDLLARIGEERALEPCLELMRSQEDERKRLRLISHISRFKDAPISVDVLPYLDHEQGRFRKFAAQMLGKLKSNSKSLNALCRAALTDPYFAVRRVAARSYQPKTVEDMDFLLSLLLAPDKLKPEVRERAGRASSAMVDWLTRWNAPGEGGASDSLIVLEPEDRLKALLGQYRQGLGGEDWQGQLAYAQVLRSMLAESPELRVAKVNGKTMREIVRQDLASAGHPAVIDTLYRVLDETE